MYCHQEADSKKERVEKGQENKTIGEGEGKKKKVNKLKDGESV